MKLGILLLALLLIGWAGYTRLKRKRAIHETDGYPGGEWVAQQIEAFLDGTGGEWDWDDFISCSLPDPFLDSIRRRADETHEKFPPHAGDGWTNAEGIEVLRGLARKAREYAAAFPVQR